MVGAYTEQVVIVKHRGGTAVAGHANASLPSIARHDNSIGLNFIVVEALRRGHGVP
jgi:hypothetical protein